MEINEEDIRKRAAYGGPYATDEDWTLFLNQASYANLDRIHLLKLLDEERKKNLEMQKGYDSLWDRYVNACQAGNLI